MKRGIASLRLCAALLACASGAGPPGEEPPAKQIPLGEVYANFDGKGLKHLPAEVIKDLGQISRDHRGPSNLFLVSGRDIEAAVKATRHALTGASAPIEDKVISPPGGDAPSAPLWLVAYLGAAWSSPPAWRVHAIERTGETIRLTYSKMSGHNFHSADIHIFLVWAPLGQPPRGMCSLELYDMDRQQVTLIRRVTVAN